MTQYPGNYDTLFQNLKPSQFLGRNFHKIEKKKLFLTRYSMKGFAFQFFIFSDFF